MNDIYPLEDILEHLFALILANSIRYCMTDGMFDIEKTLLKQARHLVSLISCNKYK